MAPTHAVGDDALPRPGRQVQVVHVVQAAAVGAAAAEDDKPVRGCIVRRAVAVSRCRRVAACRLRQSDGDVSLCVPLASLCLSHGSAGACMPGCRLQPLAWWQGRHSTTE